MPAKRKSQPSRTERALRKQIDAINREIAADEKRWREQRKQHEAKRDKLREEMSQLYKQILTNRDEERIKNREEE